jgi:preprotein translocase subunit SecG
VEFFPLLVVVLIIWLLSAIVMVVSILFHSSKGTGLSDIIAGQVYGGSTGTSIIQKNLDRITVVSAIVFMITLLAMMLIYPHGYIG